MKAIAKIGTLFASEVGIGLLERLFAIYPDGKEYPERPSEQQSFRSELPLEDPRNEMLQQILRTNGMVPWEATAPRDGTHEYKHRIERVYEPGDFDKVELLEMAPEPLVPSHDRIEDGTLKLDVSALKSKADFARSQMGTPAAIVPDRVRNILAKGHFKYLEFRPTVLNDESKGLDEILHWSQHAPWWELHSTRILPRLSTRLKLKDANGKDFVGEDFSRGCAPVEGFYQTPELRYRRGDLPDLKSFDFAFTYERFGPRPKPEDRTPIVSKRFYDFCIKHGLECRWVPVRIDNE